MNTIHLYHTVYETIHPYFSISKGRFDSSDHLYLSCTSSHISLVIVSSSLPRVLFIIFDITPRARVISHKLPFYVITDYLSTSFTHTGSHVSIQVLALPLLHSAVPSDWRNRIKSQLLSSCVLSRATDGHLCIEKVK